MSSTLSSKGSTNHYTTDAWLPLCSFLTECVRFIPDVMGQSPSKNSTFVLPVQRIFPQRSWEVIKVFVASVKQVFVLLLVSSDFHCSYKCHFCSASFLWQNHEPWPWLQSFSCCVFLCDLLDELLKYFWQCKPLQCYRWCNCITITNTYKLVLGQINRVNIKSLEWFCQDTYFNPIENRVNIYSLAFYISFHKLSAFCSFIGRIPKCLIT